MLAAAAAAVASAAPAARAVPTVEIAPGVRMPSVSLGTWSVANLKPSDPSVGVPAWLAAGGAGVDCAHDYYNQRKVAAAIAASGVPRARLFITTKVCGNPLAGPCDALSVVKADLKQLNISYADLVLLHVPLHIESGWAGLEEALAQNLTRAIGVSNFNQEQIEAVLTSGTVKPAVNQCNMSVGGHDDATIKYCHDNGIAYEAWGTLKGCDFADPTITAIAQMHNKTAAQVCLRYIIDRGCLMTVGTGKDAEKAREYAAEDLDIFGFQLDAGELAELDAL